MSAIGGLLGAPIAGWLVDNSGRQFTMVLCSIPLTIGWLLILITIDITGPLFRPLLFAGRVLAGLGIGSISLVVPVSLCYCYLVTFLCPELNFIKIGESSCHGMTSQYH